VRITGARGCCILRPSFVAAAVARGVPYGVRCSERVACCMLHRVERMQRGAFPLHACIGMVHAYVMRRAVRPAACDVRAVACCTLLLLHLLCCIVSAARCIVPVGCCCLHRATERRCARVQRVSGGVLSMSNGNVMFEDVAISDPSARRVCIARQAGRVGGGFVCWCGGAVCRHSGAHRLFAEWWRGVHA
jgi:hypothetical protein